jgi:hypothetical protein
MLIIICFRPLIPPVIWAQRNDVVFVTICVEDCLNPGVKIESEQIIFRGVAGLQKKIYAITIPLYSEVVVEVSKIQIFFTVNIILIFIYYKFKEKQDFIWW